MFFFTKFDLNNFGSDEISVELLRTQSVAVTPGLAFGKRWDKYLRISLSSNQHNFKEAINRFINFFGKF